MWAYRTSFGRRGRRRGRGQAVAAKNNPVASHRHAAATENKRCRALLLQQQKRRRRRDRKQSLSCPEADRRRTDARASWQPRSTESAPTNFELDTHTDTPRYPRLSSRVREHSPSSHAACNAGKAHTDGCHDQTPRCGSNSLVLAVCVSPWSGSHSPAGMHLLALLCCVQMYLRPAPSGTQAIRLLSAFACPRRRHC